jgi:integrase/recombinase XerD
MTRPSLRAALEDYLALRRALGFKLDNAGRLLGQFVDYLEERGIDTITTDDALAWVSLPAGASPHWLRIRLGAVRGFAAYLHGLDASVMVRRPGCCGAGRAGPLPICTPPARSSRC